MLPRGKLGSCFLVRITKSFMGDELSGGCWEAQVLVIVDKGSIYKLLGEFRLLVYVEIIFS